MSDDEIYLKHKIEIDLVGDFLSLLSQICQTLEIDSGNGQQVMIAGLAERLRTSATGMLTLGRVGLAAETKVLARVCVEITFKMQAICSSPDLMRAYAQEHLFFQKKSLEAVTTELSSSFSAEEIAEAEEKLRGVKQEIQALGAKNINVSEWAKAANLSAMYRSLYALLSGFVHASANSLEDWLPVDEEGDLVEIVSGPTDFDLSKSLLAVATCLHYCIRDLSIFFELEIDDALRALVDRRNAAYGFASEVKND